MNSKDTSSVTEPAKIRLHRARLSSIQHYIYIVRFVCGNLVFFALLSLSLAGGP